jgi:uncharacterized membrane protein
MSEYEFITIWNVNAPVEQVWDVIEDADAWPEWWKGVLSSVKLKPGDDNGVGAVRRTVWKSVLPYELEFDTEILRVESHRLIEARAFGELDGIGLWRFNAKNEKQTNVRYDWTVKTTKPWMNLLSPIARPFFRWNHDIIMGWGEDGLRRRLGV